MPREVTELLGCAPGRTYVDGTVGGGGHAREILRASSPDGRLVGIDRDEDALAEARENLKEFGPRVALVKENFRNIRKALTGLGIERVDGVLLDLGVSSFQLDRAGRGFSFRYDAPLDMRMDTSQELTAKDLVNTMGVDELARVFRDYGEEREAKRIARAIERARSRRPIETTLELSSIVQDAVPKKLQSRKIHPATRVFQALRIAVNDELGSLEEGLRAGFEALGDGGRMAVISFHSLEDRIVKEFFRELSTGCICPPRIPKCVCGRKPRAKLLTRKAVVASEEEVDTNPRSRSAKLRAAEAL